MIKNKAVAASKMEAATALLVFSTRLKWVCRQFRQRFKAKSRQTVSVAAVLPAHQHKQSTTRGIVGCSGRTPTLTADAARQQLLIGYPISTRAPLFSARTIAGWFLR